MKKVLLSGIFCLLFFITQAQVGTEFWLAPPDVSDLHNSPGGEPLYLLVQPQSGNMATVTISQPANPGFNGGTPIVINVHPGGTARRVNLTPFKASLETRPTNIIVNSGLRIQSTQPISVQYEIANTNNAEFISLKGNNALGNYFYLPFHKHLPFFNHTFAAPHTSNTTFDIVATQNSTIVTIYSPLAVDGHPPLQQFSITLNAGQTYSCGLTGSNYEQPSTHPSGAVILSTKPVAVSLKGDSEHNPSGSCYDLQAEQIVPVSNIGTDYVAVKGSLNNTGDESVILLATVNGTNVYLDGSSTPVTTMFAGEYYRVDIDYLASSSNNAVHIRATHPVYAIQYSGFGCEMGDALLPPVNHATTSLAFGRSTPETFYITLVCRAAHVNNFTITGPGTATINPASFIAVPGTSGQLMAARIQYNTTQVPVDSVFLVQNSTGAFHLAVMEGGASTGAKFTYVSPAGAGSGSLPLRLLQLSGRSANDGNYLEWLAGEDGEEYRYELQVTEAGQWTTVHTKSSGNTTADRSYQFVHRSVSRGPTSYRVKAIELGNGYTSYSNIISLQGNNRHQVQVFPNPVKEEINVRMDNINSRITATLYNANGQSVRQWNSTANNFTVPVKDLPRGVYMLKITDGTNQWQEKITKE
jgi:hypothetical protein